MDMPEVPDYFPQILHQVGSRECFTELLSHREYPSDPDLMHFLFLNRKSINVYCSNSGQKNYYSFYWIVQRWVLLLPVLGLLHKLILIGSG